MNMYLKMIVLSHSHPSVGITCLARVLSWCSSFCIYTSIYQRLSDSMWLWLCVTRIFNAIKFPSWWLLLCGLCLLLVRFITNSINLERQNVCLIHCLIGCWVFSNAIFTDDNSNKSYAIRKKRYFFCPSPIFQKKKSFHFNTISSQPWPKKYPVELRSVCLLVSATLLLFLLACIPDFHYC